MPIPVVRETWSLANARAMAANAPQLLLETSRKVGPMFKLTVGPIRLQVVAEPEALQQVLQKQFKVWGRGTAVNGIRPLLGNGLPLSDPPMWLTQRRTMQPSFHRNHGPQWVHFMRDIAGKAVEALTPGTTLVTREWMMRIARDVIVASMFSQSITDTVAFDAAFAEVEAYIATTLLPARLPLWVPTPVHRRFNRAVAYIHQRLQALIEERRRAEAPPADLLTMLLHARDPETGEGMADQQLRDEVINIFFAGHETTANLMTWAVYLLSQHVEVRARVEAEVRSVLGGRPVEPDDIARLPYLNAVVRETLRLYPPAWMFARQAFEPVELGGEAVAAGDVVLIVPYITQRLASLWPSPDTFDPSRFERESSTDAAVWKYAYLPFGAGPHVCIGNHFALLEAVTVLATVAQRGHFEVLEPSAVRTKMGATLLVDDGLPVRFVPHVVS